MNDMAKEVYISTDERNKIEMKRLYDKCIRYNIVLDDNFLNIKIIQKRY